MTEKQAITLCLRHQDPVGFEYLVSRYRREAFFHALSFMRNREEAADACQESFCRAFSAMPGISKLDQFYPWFYIILRNCCLNMLRKRNKERINSEESENSGFGDLFTSGPEKGLEKSEEREMVSRCLDRLKAEFREILLLKYTQEMDYQSIAEMLGIPRGTVMSRLYHARKAFHREYSERRKP